MRLHPDGVCLLPFGSPPARFFVPDGAGYRIGKKIRAMVIFAPHNLLADPPFGEKNVGPRLIGNA